MNRSVVIKILGYVMRIEAALMLLPTMVALIYKEKEGFIYLSVALFSLFLGFMTDLCKLKSQVFYLKEGCVATALSWILLSIIGAVPFVLTGEIPSYINALLRQYPVLRPQGRAS